MPAPAGTQYTIDGTYLRLRTVAGGGWEIDFPSGEIHKFDSDGRFVEMRDPFDNWMRVAYLPETWQISDSKATLSTSRTATEGA